MNMPLRTFVRLVLVACLAWWSLTGCREEAPRGAEQVAAPSTPAEQREALAEALAQAEAEGQWTRAEAALEALMALEPEREVTARRVRLREIRHRRRVAAALDEVGELLDAGAWRAAERWLVTLEKTELDASEQARIAQLRELARVLREEANDALLVPVSP